MNDWFSLQSSSPPQPVWKSPAGCLPMCSSGSVNHSPLVTSGCSDPAPAPTIAWRYLVVAAVADHRRALSYISMYASLLSHLPQCPRPWPRTAHSVPALSTCSPVPLITVFLEAQTIYGAGQRNIFKPLFFSTQDLRILVTKICLETKNVFMSVFFSPG